MKKYFYLSLLFFVSTTQTLLTMPKKERKRIEQDDFAHTNKLFDDIRDFKKANQQQTEEIAQLKKSNNELQEDINSICNEQPAARTVLQQKKKICKLQEEIDSCYDALSSNTENLSVKLSIIDSKPQIPFVSSMMSHVRNLEKNTAIQSNKMHSLKAKYRTTLHEYKNLQTHQESLEAIGMCCGCYATLLTGFVAYNWWMHQTHEKTE